MRRVNTIRRFLRIGVRAPSFRNRWVRSSVMMPARARRVATAASLIAFLATTMGGCRHEAAVPAKTPIAVRLADVTLYQSSEGLRYSASLIPYAQVDLAFRTTGYITGVKQIRSADGRTRDVGTGDHVTRGTVLAQIRVQDLKNQADESGAQVDSAAAQYSGRVTSISPSADARSRVFTIEVTLPNRRNTLKPGMIASVELGGRHETSQPSVPLSAI